MNYQNLEFPNSNNSAWARLMEWIDTASIPMWLVLVVVFTVLAMYFSWEWKRMMEDASTAMHGEDNNGPPPPLK